MIMLFILEARRRQKKALVRAGAARSGERIEAPCFRRHPDGPGAPWVGGTLAMGGGIDPTWTGSPDQIDSQMVLRSSTFSIVGTRGRDPGMKLGLAIVELRASSGPVELALAPADAETLSSLFGSA
jgi:hypothetical protein